MVICRWPIRSLGHAYQWGLLAGACTAQKGTNEQLCFFAAAFISGTALSFADTGAMEFREQRASPAEVWRITMNY